MLLTPPFRADQVGSLLRPAHLIEARDKYRKRLIEYAELKQIEDDAIRKVVGLQESIGLQAVSDGEFRRQSYIATSSQPCTRWLHLPAGR